MTLFSFRTLAFAWSGLAGAAAVSAAVLQVSYVPPPAPPLQAMAPTTAPVPAIVLPKPSPVPFENRSLLAMLPSAEPHLRPPVHAPEPRVAAALPVPPVPPVRIARAEPRRYAPARSYEPEPAYVADEPSYPNWAWRGRLPYPGQYAVGRGYYYGPQPGYYGWQP